MINKKKIWESLRSIGKQRYIILIGFSWSFLTIILTLLLEAFPDGIKLGFTSFLIEIIVYLIGGYFFGWFIWVRRESAYTGSKKSIKYQYILLITLSIIVVVSVFKHIIPHM